MPKQTKKKGRATKRTDRYITRLAEDLKKFREREERGEKISATERKNIRARERRVITKMKKEAQPLISEANRVLKLLEEEGISTLSQKRVNDDFAIADNGVKNFAVLERETAR